MADDGRRETVKCPAKRIPDTIPTQPRSCRATLLRLPHRLGCCWQRLAQLGRRLLTVFGSRSVDTDTDIDNRDQYICLISGLLHTHTRLWSSRWHWQATVDLLQQAALLHATGPMHVVVGGNRGTGCGQITVRRSVGSMSTRLPLGWFYLTTTTTHHPKSAAALGAAP